MTVRRSRVATATLALLVGLAADAAAQQAPLSASYSSGSLQSMITVSDLTDENDITQSQTGSIYGWWNGGTSSTSPPVGQNDARYASAHDGVARLLIDFGGGSAGCTGSLISSFEILTAAHCVFDGVSYRPGNSVTATFFQTGTSTSVSIQSTQIIGKPGYDGSVISNHDVAIVRLERAADLWIPRYSLFSGNPMWQEVFFAGYGLSGNGLTGGVISEIFRSTPTRRVASNRFDSNWTESGSLTTTTDGSANTPILASDFDGAAPAGTYPVTGGSWSATTLSDNDTMCNAWTPTLTGTIHEPLLADLCHQGYGLFEGMIGSGDSGGPAFVNDGGVFKVAAVASFGDTRCVPSQATPAQTSSGCPTGYVRNGSYFSSTGGHVTVSYGENYDFVAANTTPDTTVPEPLSLLLVGSGLAGVAVTRRRRRDEEAGRSE